MRAGGGLDDPHAASGRMIAQIVTPQAVRRFMTGKSDGCGVSRLAFRLVILRSSANRKPGRMFNDLPPALDHQAKGLDGEQ
jgi:hypothetical protein